MRNRSETASWLAVRRRAPVLAAALLGLGCSSVGATRPAAIAVRDARGFTITEKVRVSAAVRADFERAVGLMHQERYDGAIPLLVEVTEAAPDVTAPHIDLAIAYGRVNDLERAQASIKRALELDPRHPVAHNELGIIYRRTGRFQEARQSYETALALYPDFHFAQRNLAILCDLYLADLNCALEHYEAYSRAVPDDETAAMWIADLRTRAGR